ncbi:DUF1419 domain-containing protein [Roseibium sp.]|uniref:DUF1419 domain-containing protein n=1 Tax=Roseibium sp. TaxID=1936156 RepID=UPI003D13AC49
MTSSIRKIYFGVTDRHLMFRLFDRHAQRPERSPTGDGALYAGEWFEIDETQHDYMLNIPPPLWMRGEMFAMREFLSDSITSVFYTLRINGVTRYFHAYCDLSDPRACNDIRDAIVDRERRPVKAMTREHRGKRMVRVYGKPETRFALLEHLTDEQISEKLPVHLRYLPLQEAA